MLKLLLISIFLVAIAFLGFGVKLLFDKKAEFAPGCASANPELKGKGVGCGCGGGACANEVKE